jgi:thioredoxin 1
MNTDPHQAATVEIGAATFEAEVLRSKRPTLVAFCSPWSRPCQILRSSLEAVASACDRSVRVCSVNADDNPDLSIWYEIQSVPTLLYFLNGRLCAKTVGTVTPEAILSKLQSVLQQPDSTSITADGGKKNP